MPQPQEKLTYNDTEVPIYRAGMPEVFVVLPGWKAAQQMLAERPAPYSLQ